MWYNAGMKVKKWYIILIGSFIVLVLGLAVIVYIFKTPTDFGYAPNTLDLIFDFLDKWASAGAPAITLLAVIVALGIGVISIIQIRKLHESRYKEDIFDSILDWIQNIFECEIKATSVDMQVVTIGLDSTFLAGLATGVRWREAQKAYTMILSKGITLREMFNNRNEPIPKAIDKLLDVLTKLVGIHDKYEKLLGVKPLDTSKLIDLTEKHDKESGALAKDIVDALENLRTEVLKEKHKIRTIKL